MEEAWKKRTKNSSEEDRLVPLESLDIGAIDSFDAMLEAMSLTAFNGRRLGEAAEVLEAMVTDPDCTVVLTLSGAMTVAKMNLVITEMIERGWVQAVVSTGALMTHGLVELAGMTHFKGRSDLNDQTLFERGYNRVYDTYELEANLNALSRALSEEVFPDLTAGDGTLCSRELLEAVGRWLAPRGRGAISAAYKMGVPIYVPAFTDSEMGLDLAAFFIRGLVHSGLGFDEAMAAMRSRFDPFRDLTHYASLIRKSPRVGIFTIGGGVPRNWAQQACPFLDILNVSLDLDMELNRFRYGVRICPEPVHWGGLSGCTYSEGVSWGKFVPEAEGGRFAEIYSDATLVCPMLVKGVAQRFERKNRPAAHPTLDLPGLTPRPPRDG